MALKVLLADTAQFDKFCPPLALGYLTSYARKCLGSGSIEFKAVDRDIENAIESYKPDVFAMSSLTPYFNIAESYAAIAKKHGIPVIIGGMHISTLPQNLSKDMDVAVIGEGEKTFTELMQLFEAGRSFDDKKKLESIDGLAYREDGVLKTTKPRELITPLDDIPLPDRDLFQINEYTHMFTSRGCPYRCVYCFSARFWKVTRFFSPEYVINEINTLIKKYGVKRIFLSDDLFIADKKRFRRIVELIKQEGIDRKVSFECFCRANLIDDEIAILLKQMNVTLVDLGLESLHSRVLQYLKGNTVTVEQNIKSVEILKKHGVEHVIGYFIFGSPDETKEEMLHTISVIRKMRLDGIGARLLTPLPGTPLWDYALSRNLVSNDMEWKKTEIDFEKNHDTAIVVSEKLTRQELCDVYKKYKREMQVKRVQHVLRSLPFVNKFV